MSYYIYYIVTPIVLYLFRKFFLNGPRSPVIRNLKNKIVIVTGSSGGIGQETALQLLKNEAIVIFACRDKTKTEKIISDLTTDMRDRSHFIKLDLSSLASVFEFVKNFKRQFGSLDILINNAGMSPLKFELTEDKIENTFQSNHIGHMVLTYLLLDYFKSEEGRIINVSGDIYKISNYSVKKFEDLQNNLDYKGIDFSTNVESIIEYSNSKLANIYFTNYLGDLLEKKFNHIKTMSLHPGVISTELMRNATGFFYYFRLIISPLFWYCTKTPDMGAQTTLYLCYEFHDKLKNKGYYLDCKERKKCNLIEDEDIQNEMIKYSWMLIDRAIEGKFELNKYDI